MVEAIVSRGRGYPRHSRHWRKWLGLSQSGTLMFAGLQTALGKEVPSTG
jgi:hypothetical protein